MKSIELQYPITEEINGEKKEIKFLTPQRLKVKHFELLPATLMSKASEDGKVNFDMKEMLPLFSELVPFLAGIFGVSEEAIREVDFDDVENVIGALEEVFPKDQKKN